MASRHVQYKNVGKDSEALSKSRFENIVNIRKDKREETLSKRRNIPSALVTPYFVFLFNFSLNPKKIFY